MKRSILMVVFITVVLLLSSSSFAQTQETSARLNDPVTLPQNRADITAENANMIDLLAMWGPGNLSDVIWIDDTHVAVASHSGTWIYDLENPLLPMTLIPSLAIVRPSLSISPDNQWLSVTPNFERFSNLNVGFRIWHIPTGNSVDLGSLHASLAPPVVLSSSDQLPLFVKWLPDNRYMTAYRTDIVLWRLSSDGTASVDLVLNHPRTERTSYHIEQVAVSYDMRWIASVIRSDISEQTIVQLWDTTSGEAHVLYEDDFLPQNPLLVDALEFNADNSELLLLVRVIADSDRYEISHAEIRRWSIDSGEMLPAYSVDCGFEMIARYDIILCGERDYQRDGYSIEIKHIEDGSAIFEPVLLDIQSGLSLQYLRSIFVNKDSLVGVIHNRDEQSNEQIYADNILIWNLETEEITSLNVGSERFNHLAISPDETRVALLQNNQVQIWDIETETREHVLEHTGLLTIENLATSPDGNYLIVIGSYPDPVLYERRFPTRTIRFDLRTGAFEVLSNENEAFSAAYSPDNRQLVLGRTDGMLRIYDAETLTLQNTLFNDGSVGQVTFSNNGRILAAASERYIRFWDVQGWQIVNRVDATSGFFYDRLLFTADDEWLVYNRRIYDIEGNGQLVAAWNRDSPSDEVSLLAQNPVGYQTHSYDPIDGFLLHGTESPNRLTLIDANLSQALWYDDYQSPRITAVAISENLIFSGSSDGVIRVYGIVPERE